MSDTSRFPLLEKTLVLCVRKSFWASPECAVFPHRLYTRRLMPGSGVWGSSRNPLNTLNVILGGLLEARRRKTRLLIVASASRAAVWMARSKQAGLLQGTRLLAITQSYLADRYVPLFDRIVVYSSSEVALHPPALRDRYVFIPLPADGDFSRLISTSGEYIFAGGGAGRDFPSLIEAVRGLNLPLKLVTFSPKNLGASGPLPENVTVQYTLPVQQYLEVMAGAKFVVAPLQPGLHPHGHTTIVQALRLGKAVITTRGASAEDYIRQEEEGLLVQPGDRAGYREAILRLDGDETLRRRLEAGARCRQPELTYAHFRDRLVELCLELLETKGVA